MSTDGEIEPVDWTSLALSMGLLLVVAVAAFAPAWLWVAASAFAVVTIAVVAVRATTRPHSSECSTTPQHEAVDAHWRLRGRMFTYAVEHWLHNQPGSGSS